MGDLDVTASYDPFARCYARWWGPQFADRLAGLVERLALAGLPVGARALDVCCGSGDVAAVLAAKGHQVTGVDISEDLLTVARHRAPEARFLRQDARDLHVPDAFDVAYSVFDSLNHMPTEDDLGRVFVAVHRALRPGGVFLFDVNTEAAYLEQWDDAFGFAEDDLACVLRVGYDRQRRRGTFDATVFELDRDGAWRRDDILLCQRPWEPHEVRPLLARAGFSDVRQHDAAADLEFDGGIGRLVFVARRPSDR